MIQRLIGEDIELNVSLGKLLWAVKADPGQIVQVLMNLCVNARDAMAHGGELRIRNRECLGRCGSRKETSCFCAGRLRCTGCERQRNRNDRRKFKPTSSTHSSPPRSWGKEPGSDYPRCTASSSKAEDIFGSIANLVAEFFHHLPSCCRCSLDDDLTPEITKCEGQGETILLAEDDDDCESRFPHTSICMDTKCWRRVMEPKHCTSQSSTRVPFRCLSPT